MEEKATKKEPGKSSVRVKTVTVDIGLARELGIESAFFYSYLIEKLTNPFTMQVVVTVKEMQADTGMSEYIQRRALKDLETAQLLQVVRTRTSPSKRMIWFRKLSERQLDKARKRFRSIGKNEDDAYADFFIG